MKVGGVVEVEAGGQKSAAKFRQSSVLVPPLAALPASDQRSTIGLTTTLELRCQI